jgi:hypothetical protein
VEYQTQILEFIDMEHTPKNLLIRSVRRPDRNATDSAARAIMEVRRLRSQLGLPPLTLERRLIELNRLIPEVVPPIDAAHEVPAKTVLAAPEESAGVS